MRDFAEQVGRELFDRTITESPQMRALFLRAWEGAYRTGLEKKRWLFGAIVKQALDHPAEFNDAWLKLQALEELDAPHIEALERLGRLYDAHTGWEDDSTSESVFGHLFEAYNTLWKTLPPPVSAVLVRTGVAVAPPIVVTTLRRAFPLLTDFGRGLLQEYRAMPVNSTLSFD